MWFFLFDDKIPHLQCMYSAVCCCVYIVWGCSTEIPSNNCNLYVISLTTDAPNSYFKLCRSSSLRYCTGNQGIMDSCSFFSLLLWNSFASWRKCFLEWGRWKLELFLEKKWKMIQRVSIAFGYLFSHCNQVYQGSLKLVIVFYDAYCKRLTVEVLCLLSCILVSWKTISFKW